MNDLHRSGEVAIGDDNEVPRVTLNPITEHLELEYPCLWVYKLIGPSEDDLRAAVLETIAGVEYTVELSNRSSRGRYVSLNVHVTVSSEGQRTGIYEALRRHRAGRLVLGSRHRVSQRVFPAGARDAVSRLFRA